MRFVLAITLLLVSQLNFGQQHDLSQLESLVEFNPDSVRQVSFQQREKISDPKRIAAYYHIIGLSYQAEGELGQSTLYFQKEDSLFQYFEPTTEQRIDNAYQVADNLYYKGELSAADSIYQSLIPQLKEVSDYQLKCNVLLDAGWLSRERGRHAEALEYYFQSNKLAEINDDQSLLANGYSKIAVVYHVKQEFESAKKYYDLAMNIYQELNEVSRIARLYNNYGLLYMDQRKPNKAIGYFERSIELCDSLGNIRGVAIANENMGLVCYEDLENYTLALDRFKRSLDIWRSFDDKYGQAQTLVYMIYVYNAQGNWNAAIDSGYHSLELSLASGAKDVERDLYKEMSIAFEGQGNSAKALEFFKKHIALRDNLMADNKLDEIQKMEIRNELATKQFKDSLNMAMKLEQESAELDLQVKEQRMWNIIMALGLVGLLVIVFLVYRSSQQRKKTAELIEKANLLLKTKNSEIIDSMNYAKRIQEAILPTTDYIKEKLASSFIYYLPKDIVAGDFYWVEKVGFGRDSKILFAVADCTGHGVPGAMVSVICSNALNKAVNEVGLSDPAQILEKVTEIVIEQFAKSGRELKDGMDVSLIALSRNKDNVKVEYAGANNPLWIIKHNSKAIEEIKATKRPVGKYHVNIPFVTNEVILETNDQIYLFTDGYADQFGGEKNKKFKYKALKELLISVADLPPSEQKEKIAERFEIWKGNIEQVDDVCVAGIRL